MGTDQALFILNKMIVTASMIGAPILLATLFTGLLISVLQVTTQIQEITLSYVPKIIVTALMIFLLGPWMLGKTLQFATSLYRTIPNINSF